MTNNRSETAEAFGRLLDPIPYLDEMTGTGRTWFVFGGGFLFWLVFGFVVVCLIAFKYLAIGAYIGAVEAGRLLIALGWLAWWGCASGTAAVSDFWMAR
jgi:hypothetical protein